MFKVSIPQNSYHEGHWVLVYILEESFNCECVYVETDRNTFEISAEGKTLLIANTFIGQDSPTWLQSESVPRASAVKWWKVGSSSEYCSGNVPVLFGEPKIDFSEQSVFCHIDVVGFVFFFLSRYEEIANLDRDERDRFQAGASIAGQCGFLDHPVVDYYVEMLWGLMERLWPSLARPEGIGGVEVTCDVDQPYDRALKAPHLLVRALASDVLRRRLPSLTVKRMANYGSRLLGWPSNDPYDSFAWFMDRCEYHDHVARFFWISGNTSGAIDGCYSLAEDRIRDLLVTMNERGHEIGMHGSYNTWRSAKSLEKERDCLLKTCGLLSISVDQLANRQHYLRWDASQTQDHLDGLGFEYDYSGGFADQAGFRYGTAREFSMWSWTKMKPLALRQRPLIAMEVSIISSNYMGLGYSSQAYSLAETLKARATRYGGTFTLLWHNCHLTAEVDREFFEALLKN